MHLAVEERIESERGCGYRKPGGLYLVADGLAGACGVLPIPLDRCPCCGAGVKPSRGWTWVDGTALIASAECTAGSLYCARCPLGGKPGRVGLLWVGGVYYPKPEDWSREAMLMGVSRRIPAVPRDFVVGQTWVWVAHREVIRVGVDRFLPAVFHAFRPQAVEYVVKGTETDEQIDELIKRGLTPVRVIRDCDRNGQEHRS